LGIIMSNIEKVASLLNQDDIRSRVIRDAAFFDYFVTLLIGLYFCPSSRASEFVVNVGERLSFEDKVTILKKLEIDKQYKSLECISTLKKVQRLRNILAHEFYISHGHKVFNDNSITKWFADYPVSYKRDVKNAKMQLRRLADTKEFTKYHV
ncbi:hypothetical protein ACTE7C_003577, partial [Vibrio cholerae]